MSNYINRFLQAYKINDAIIKKLKEAGYTTIPSFETASLSELKSLGLDIEIAQRLLSDVKTMSVSFRTASALDEERKGMRRIMTGSAELDGLLGGGIPIGIITEFYGYIKTGKTQLCHQLSVCVQLAKDKGGLEGQALFFDTQNTFRPERIIHIAERFGLAKSEVLSNIIVSAPCTSDHQLLALEQAEEKILSNHNIKLIIVDSLMSHFVAEYIGMEMMALRQARITKYLHDLLRLARTHGLAVVVTNQVFRRPTFFGEEYVQIGGTVVESNVQLIVHLMLGRGPERIARLVKAPDMREGECIFKISEGGIEDVS
jgi:DNA repair protein RadA